MSRSETIARAFLRYLYEDSHFRPEVAGFLDGPGPQADISHDEFAAIVESLREKELIATSGPDAEGLPRRAGLTGSGLICAGHHDGDVEAWTRAREAPVGVLEQPEPSEPVIPSQAAPPTRADFAGLARVARVVLLTLPTVQARSGDGDLVEHTARQLWECARRPDPDARRVRLFARRLREELRTGPVADTLGIVLLDGLDEEMAQAGIDR
ncbi:hypothetical protein HUO13_21185 [Saccharopolyspora erythraea]|uniref:hypothetical protein n=1 Tax=Saccharopolyspora erythraea TaxID=1836 RepID=UPI001BA523EE|nr:hypothetical protein [Saccharopolyspora erythraea]QUH02996.1 hypothetical protein HUO13_21185 [Saccharopolyspora erythraea]